MGCSVVYACRHVFDLSPVWPPRLRDLVGLDEADLIDCALVLIDTHQRALKDCIRSCERGLGPPTRAQALPLPLLGRLPGHVSPWVENGPMAPRNVIVPFGEKILFMLIFCQPLTPSISLHFKASVFRKNSCDMRGHSELRLSPPEAVKQVQSRPTGSIHK